MFANVLCFCLFLLPVLTERIDQDENDICKQEGDQLWTCKKLSKCPTAIADLKRGRRPVTCSFVGSEQVVCCRPSLTSKTTSANSERISKQKCREYGQAVFISPKHNRVTDLDSCAAEQPLIVSGWSASPREFPHMALIGYGERNNTKWLCGGSLISEQFVLSAAHCTDAGIRGYASWVRLGDYDIFSTEDEENGKAQSREYEIIERINHPEYKRPSVYNDIALYKLKEIVKFNEYVRPLCLHTDHTFAGRKVFETTWDREGWRGGKIGTIRKIDFVVTGKKECANAYNSSSGASVILTNGVADATQLCAKNLDHNRDLCEGYTGSPLQIRLLDPYCMYSLVGVTSFRLKCAANYPQVYTRVSHYVSWIESIVWL